MLTRTNHRNTRPPSIGRNGWCAHAAAAGARALPHASARSHLDGRVGRVDRHPLRVSAPSTTWSLSTQTEYYQYPSLLKYLKNYFCDRVRRADRGAAHAACNIDRCVGWRRAGLARDQQDAAACDVHHDATDFTRLHRASLRDRNVVDRVATRRAVLQQHRRASLRHRKVHIVARAERRGEFCAVLTRLALVGWCMARWVLCGTSRY